MRVEHIGDATLYLGDCLDVMPSIERRSIDMVLADPPYGTTRSKWDSVIPLQPMWEQFDRLCVGPIVLTAQTPFDKVLGASNLRDLRYEWIWEKTHPTGHLNAKRAPMKAHENVLVFYRQTGTYNPIMTHGHVRKTAKKSRDLSPVYGKQNAEGISYDSTSRYPRSVLTFASDKQRSNLHPAQKPVALLDYLVRTYTHPGQLVLDNCMGSASSGVAALMNGRKYIGIEKDPAIYDVAVRRIREFIEAAMTTPSPTDKRNWQ